MAAAIGAIGVGVTWLLGGGVRRSSAAEDDVWALGPGAARPLAGEAVPFLPAQDTRERRRSRAAVVPAFPAEAVRIPGTGESEERVRSRAGAARRSRAEPVRGRPHARPEATGSRRRPSGDRGSAAVEFIGFLPVLLLVGLAAIQLGLAAFAAQQAGTGARAAARTATLDDPRTTPEAAARTAMTDWVARRADTVQAPPCTPGTTEVTATVDVSVPGLLPGTGFHVTRHATMRCPNDAHAPAGAPAGPSVVPLKPLPQESRP